PRRRAQRRARFDQSGCLPAPNSIRFDEIDCRPVIYHPVISVGQILVGSGYVVSKLELLEVKLLFTLGRYFEPFRDFHIKLLFASTSSPKKKADKAKKPAKRGQSSSLEGSVPLEEAPSSVDASEVAAKKKKKKKDNKKRSREEASVEPPETSMAVGDDDVGRHDPTDSTRGSSEGRPEKKSKKTTAEDDGTSAPEVPSKSGGQATETGDGSRDESPLKRFRAENKKASDKAVKEKEVLRAAEDPTDKPMIDITSALSKRITVTEGTAVEECSDKNDPEVGGNAIQEGTGDVAAEDPVLVSSSEEWEDDEGATRRSFPALIEEAALNPSASDPLAQIEGLNAHAAEETVELLFPVVSNKDDQDTSVSCCVKRTLKFTFSGVSL
ncbi:LOW QUALITY PROTEIN: hypothetical protein HID58_018704, partial [Brassica napus]